MHIHVSSLSLQTNTIITVLLLKLSRYIWISVISKFMYSVNIIKGLDTVERTWTLVGLLSVIKCFDNIIQTKTSQVLIRSWPELTLGTTQKILKCY